MRILQDDYDKDMMKDAKKIRLIAIISSLVLSLVILAIKLYAAKVSNSTALRSDALEGTVNVLAAAFGLGAILFSEKPADKEHPYGHGKIEYFSAAFEGGLITLSGFLIFLDSISRMISPHVIADLDTGLKLNLLAGGMNGIVGASLVWIGKKYYSETLRADGIHLLTDLLTTVVLALGLVLVLFTGWTFLDPILAIGVALFLLKTGFGLIRKSSNALLDAENPELLNSIVVQLNQIDRGAIIAIHELKAQQFGRDKHIDLHLVVPEFFRSRGP